MSRAAAPPVLEIRGARRHFGGVKAVDNLSFSVAKGEVLAVVGPNGAGKSTMFNLICGQLPLSAGDVLFNGRSVRRLSPHRRARLGMGRSFQQSAVCLDLTVLENVQMPLSRVGSRPVLGLASSRHRARALEILDEVGLADEAARPAGSLSHGDKKRLELAVLITVEPSLLLLDEPTAGMAVAERAAVMSLLMEIVAKRNLTMVFTEHDMDTVFAVAERLIVMERGSLLADGPPAEVRLDPRVREVYLGSAYKDGITG